VPILGNSTLKGSISLLTLRFSAFIAGESSFRPIAWPLGEKDSSQESGLEDTICQQNVSKYKSWGMDSKNKSSTDGRWYFSVSQMSLKSASGCVFRHHNCGGRQWTRLIQPQPGEPLDNAIKAPQPQPRFPHQEVKYIMASSYGLHTCEELGSEGHGTQLRHSNSHSSQLLGKF